VTEAQFNESVQAEINAISRRATLEAEIASARDDFRQLADEDASLQAKRLAVFSRTCATASRLYRLEAELEKLTRRGTA
jgi:chromosome segregation ATPase